MMLTPREALALRSRDRSVAIVFADDSSLAYVAVAGNRVGGPFVTLGEAERFAAGYARVVVAVVAAPPEGAVK